MKRFYIDTSIWMDYGEDRKGFHNEPLGTYAEKLLSHIKTNGDKIVVSEFVLNELQTHYSMDVIRGIMRQFIASIEHVQISDIQIKEANTVSKQRNIPLGDAIHAIIARDAKFILVTRDKHFYKTLDITPFYRPEELC